MRVFEPGVFLNLSIHLLSPAPIALFIKIPNIPSFLLILHVVMYCITGFSKSSAPSRPSTI
jgi:hypothetical protein